MPTPSPTRRSRRYFFVSNFSLISAVSGRICPEISADFFVDGGENFAAEFPGENRKKLKQRSVDFGAKVLGRGLARSAQVNRRRFKMLFEMLFNSNLL